MALPQNTIPSMPTASRMTAQQNVLPEELPLDLVSKDITREDILSDKLNRIPEAFKLQEGLRRRVGFWFDIYTRYSSRYHVIHHVDYPWIIYKVIDTTKIFLADTGTNKWTKYHRAKALVKNEQAFVRNELYKMSRMKNYNRLTIEQQRYYNILQEVPGSRKTVFANASKNLRTQLGQKDFYRGGLMSSSKYLPLMEEIFAQYDLPVELTRLPLVESSFNENAISKVGASGIWQFMPLVGKAYLKITDNIDERNSPLKATEAAAKLMMMNFKITQAWPLAITAYNHGASGIMKASRISRSRDLPTIIDRYSSHTFGFASSNFFCSFVAALYGERYQDEVFGDVPKLLPHRSDMLKLSTNYRAKTFIDIAGITMEELRLFNPDLKAKLITPNTTLPRGYRVFLPQGRKAQVELHDLERVELAKQQLLSKKQASRTNKKRIRVSSDDRSKPSKTTIVF